MINTWMKLKINRNYNNGLSQTQNKQKINMSWSDKPHAFFKLEHNLRYTEKQNK